MVTPGKHGDPQLRDAWRPLSECGEKTTISNFELWDNRRFLDWPLQLCTPENQVVPGTVWTGNIPEAWQEEPDFPEKQRVATALAHKPRLGQ